MNKIIQEYSGLIERDLNRLINEIESYTNPEKMWIKTEQAPNSAGHLTLHICGNLQHFIGAVIGNTGYIRKRELEFTSDPVSALELKQVIERTKLTVYEVLTNTDDSLLSQTYPIQVFGYEMSHQHFLLHLLGHLNYHLGQINYHRRLLS